MSNKPETIVSKWLDHITTMEQLHNQAYDYHNSKSFYCLCGTMIVLIISGIYGLINVHFYYVTVLLSIVNIFTVFVLAYSKCMDWDRLALDHQHNVKAYIKVRKLIELHIIMVSIDKEETMYDMIPEIASLLTKIESENIRLPDHLKPKINHIQPIIEPITDYNKHIEIFNDHSEINKQSSKITFMDISEN